MKHTISIKVRNHAGVMSHVSGLFARRGFNIESIAVGVTDNSDISIITIVVKESDEKLLQIISQLRKMVDVLDVRDLPYNESITRELALISINVAADQRSDIMGIMEVFGGRINDISQDTMLVEVSGNARQIKTVITLLKPYGIREIVRTGQIAIAYQS